MLKCDNLCASVAHKEILHDVSFALSVGQNLLILGENGVGKSTLAKALCALAEYSGNVSLFGQELRLLAPKERAKLINYVPPKLHVYDEELTLHEYILSGRFAYKNKFEPYGKEEHRAVSEALCRFGLERLENERVARLSSGEKQLAVTLQALMQNSRITIFDEPIANIDTTRAGTLFGLLAGESAFQNKIVITHDLHFAFSLGFDILHLKDGTVEFFGSGSEFFQAASLAARYGHAVRLSSDGVTINYEKN